MIGIDTNVLVRYLAQDDPRQALIATQFIEQKLSAENPGFISLVVLIELCWVLKKIYSATEDELHETIVDLLVSDNFVIESREVVHASIRQIKLRKNKKVGFVDALIVQISKFHGCTDTVSFDKSAVQSAGMTFLE